MRQNNSRELVWETAQSVWFYLHGLCLNHLHTLFADLAFKATFGAISR